MKYSNSLLLLHKRFKCTHPQLIKGKSKYSVLHLLWLANLTVFLLWLAKVVAMALDLRHSKTRMHCQSSSSFRFFCSLEIKKESVGQVWLTVEATHLILVLEVSDIIMQLYFEKDAIHCCYTYQARMAQSVSARPWWKRSWVRFPALASLFRLLSSPCSFKYP